MTTPVLSKKQQRKALSGKKGPAKGLRNVLAQPYEFFWPILKIDNIDEIKLLLETSMPAIKRPALNIPWSRLHRMNKTERRAARDEARTKLNVPLPDEKILNSIVMGVNGVTRLLEKNDASCIILEATVEPMLLIKHIVSMAESKVVPVILVPSLKNMMLEIVGFACAALAMKKTVAETKDHHFHNLYKKVVELAANIERNRPSEPDSKEDITRRLSFGEWSVDREKSCDKEVIQTSKSFSISTDVYKYRNSRRERVFVPENAKGSEDTVTQKFGSDFISVSEDLDPPVSETRRVEGKRRTRYIDVHGKDSKNSPEMEDCRMQLDEDVPPDRKVEYFDPSTNNGDAMESEVLYETKSPILGMNDESPLYFGNDKPEKANKKGNKNFKYKSLKVKRIQGNSKRVKATKVSNKNKK